MFMFQGINGTVTYPPWVPIIKILSRDPFGKAEGFL